MSVLSVLESVVQGHVSTSFLACSMSVLVLLELRQQGLLLMAASHVPVCTILLYLSLPLFPCSVKSHIQLVLDTYSCQTYNAIATCFVRKSNFETHHSYM